MKKGHATLTNLVTGLSPVVKNTTQTTEAPVADSVQSKEVPVQTNAPTEEVAPVASEASVERPDVTTLNTELSQMSDEELNNKADELLNKDAMSEVDRSDLAAVNGELDKRAFASETQKQTTEPTFIDRLPDLHDYANELVDGRSRLSNERSR